MIKEFLTATIDKKRLLEKENLLRAFSYLDRVKFNKINFYRIIVDQ